MTNPAGAAGAAPPSTERPPAGSAGRRVLHGLFIGMCFLGSLGATAWWVDGRLPFPSVPEIAPRFRYFAERKNDFDTVFIGSSRVRHQVIPKQFDEKTAALGAATRSFNLGYSGMWPPESFYFLRRVLALHPQRLRWVIIELMDYRFGQVEGQATTMRSVYWHDARHSAMALRLVAETALPMEEKLSLTASHAGLFLQRMANLGSGAEWLQQRYFPAKKKTEGSWAERRGFDPEESTTWSDHARADYAAKIAAFEQASPPGPVRAGFVDDVQALVREVRRAGAEPVFVLPPTVRLEERFASLPAGVTVWRFDQPAQYSRLYLPELHYDPGHLNAAGAGEFTDLLAERFAELAGRK